MVRRLVGPEQVNGNVEYQGYILHVNMVKIGFFCGKSFAQTALGSIIPFSFFLLSRFRLLRPSESRVNGGRVCCL